MSILKFEGDHLPGAPRVRDLRGAAERVCEISQNIMGELVAPDLFGDPVIVNNLPCVSQDGVRFERLSWFEEREDEESDRRVVDGFSDQVQASGMRKVAATMDRMLLIRKGDRVRSFTKSRLLVPKQVVVTLQPQAGAMPRLQFQSGLNQDSPDGVLKYGKNDGENFDEELSLDDTPIKGMDREAIACLTDLVGTLRIFEAVVSAPVFDIDKQALTTGKEFSERIAEMERVGRDPHARSRAGIFARANDMRQLALAKLHI